MVTSETKTIDRQTSPRISSVQLKAMRDVKPPSLIDRVARTITNLWASVTSGLGYMFAAKQSRKSFCELNGHSVKMVNGTVTNKCRYCDQEINSIEMLTSR